MNEICLGMFVLLRFSDEVLFNTLKDELGPGGRDVVPVSDCHCGFLSRSFHLVPPEVRYVDTVSFIKSEYMNFRCIEVFISQVNV